MAIVTCSCGGRFRAADRLAGATVPCPRCGAGLTIPAVAEIVLESPTAPAAVQEREVGTYPVAPAPSARVTPAPIIEAADETCSYSDAAPGLGPFLADCGRSLLFIAEPHNLMVFLIVASFLALRHGLMAIIALTWLGYGMILGLIAISVLCGALVAFLFSVVEESAGGQERLPELSLSDGYFDGFVAPLGRALAAIVICLAPALVYLLALGPTRTRQVDNPGSALLVLYGAGVFAAPMVLLVVAMGGIGAVIRVDLLLLTIARTIVPYVCTVVLASTTVVGMEGALELMEGTGLYTSGSRVAFAIIADVFRLYGLVVAMRMVGLYYFHFKERFAWSWG